MRKSPRVARSGVGTLLMIGMLVVLLVGGWLFSTTSGVEPHPIADKTGRGVLPKGIGPAANRGDFPVATVSPAADDDKMLFNTPGCGHFADLPARFVTFEPWPGGWNNRRLSLECAALFAVLTDRTLVLPPRLEGIRDEHIPTANVLNYEEAYNMTLMRELLPVVSYEELMTCGYRTLWKGLPLTRADPKCAASTKAGTKERAFCDLSVVVSSRATWVVATNSSSESPTSVPGATSQDMTIDCKGSFFPLPFNWLEKQGDPIQHARRPQRIPRASTATILHFPRSLLAAYGNLLFFDPRWNDERFAAWSIDNFAPVTPSPTAFVQPDGSKLRREALPMSVKARVFGTMGKAFQYNDRVKSAAKLVIAALGGIERFSCVHLRRKDFVRQYASISGDPKSILLNLLPLFNEKEPVFIATDDDAEIGRLLNSFLPRKKGTGDNRRSSAKKVSITNMGEADAMEVDEGELATVQWVWWSLLVRESVIGSNAFLQLKRVPSILLPLVVQEVCIGARVFAANPLSSYSGWIVRQRGFQGAMGPYYTTVRLPGAAEQVELKRKQEMAAGNLTAKEQKALRAMQPDNLDNMLTPVWGQESKFAWTDL